MKIEAIGTDSYVLSKFAFGPLSGRRYVVFDLEATGPDPAADAITQIGAVAVYADGPRDGESFCCLVRPWKAIPPKIEQLTGVTNALAATASGFAAVWQDFARFCDDSPLVAQCGYEFDFKLLDRECSRAGIRPLTQERLDTKATFALEHPQRDEVFSTDFLVSHYGVDRGAFKRHDALGDAKLIARVFHAQLQEARRLGRDEWRGEQPVRVKRFVPPPL